MDLQKVNHYPYSSPFLKKFLTRPSCFFAGHARANNAHSQLSLNCPKLFIKPYSKSVQSLNSMHRTFPNSNERIPYLTLP
jgi:hypothetical protein